MLQKYFGGVVFTSKLIENRIDSMKTDTIGFKVAHLRNFDPYMKKIINYFFGLLYACLIRVII